MTQSELKVLWLRPSTGDNVSVRRQRIAEHLEEMGIETELVDVSGRDLPGAIRTALTGDHDIIVGNVRMGLYLGYPLARLLGKPFVGDVSDPIEQIKGLPAPIYRLIERYEWYILKRADATVFVYESSYQTAKEHGIKGRKLPNAVNYSIFANPDPSAIKTAKDVLTNAGVDLHRKIGIYTGTLTDRYSLTELSEAATKADGWDFVFIGDGDMKTEFEAFAGDIDNIYYLGTYEHHLIPGFLYHADVGFCLIDAEQPLKLKEYGAAGLPIIAQPGGLSQLYDKDELMFVEPSSEAIADALDRLTDDALRARYAAAGQKIASERSWKTIAEGYQDIFYQIV